MKVKFALFANLRDLVGSSEVEFETHSEGELMKVMSDFADSQGERFQNLIFDGEGNIHASVIVLVNGKPVEKGVPHQLGEGDEIAILLPTAGG